MIPDNVNKFLNYLEADQELYTQKYVDKKDNEIERLKNDIKRITNITNKKINIINEVREKVKGVKKINNEVYKQTDMLERFYSRKWCNDEMDSFLEILDKTN